MRRAAPTGRGRGAGLGPRLRAYVGLAALTALSGTVLSACGGSSSYSVTAMFPTAEGLFPGNAVQVLGVQRGSVTAVTPQNGVVVVTMSIEGDQSLPAGVHAALTTPQLLGEPSIELSPGYTGGPKLAAGAVIPKSRTSVPESIGQLLHDMQAYLGQVDTSSLSGFVTNLAQDLRGQGQQLNELISGAAGTLQILAEKGNALGQLDGSLAQITATLRQRTATVSQLLQAYEQVANVLATQSGPLGDSITQLAQMSQQLTTLLDPNLNGLQGDIASITRVGRTLDRNLSNLDQGLSSSVALFTAAGRAYDPVYNWLNLNNQLAPGTTSGVLEGLIRDRLAGVCRRVLANHSSGLSQSDISTLESCGNPDSGYFDPLLSTIPTLLTALNGSQPPSPQSVLSQGATMIPGLSQSQQSSVSNIQPSQLSTTTTTAPSLGAPALPPLPAGSNTTTTTSGGLLGNLLHGVMGVGHFLGSLL